jgi:hypothetical protein
MSKSPEKQLSEKRQLPFKKQNYKIMLIGLAVVALGYLMMMGGAAEKPTDFNADELFSFRRIFIAPFTVLTGYVIIMVGIMKKPKED